jgi:hypothetical protein
MKNIEKYDIITKNTGGQHMKRLILFTLVVIIVMGVLAGCASKEWQTFNEFFGEFKDVPDEGGVKKILSGYQYEQKSVEMAQNFLFDRIEVWGNEWSGAINVTDIDVGVTIRKSFEEESDRDQFYQKVLEQLTSEFGKGSEGTLESGTEYIGWEDSGWKASVMMTTFRDLPAVSVMYHAMD